MNPFNVVVGRPEQTPMGNEAEKDVGPEEEPNAVPNATPNAEEQVVTLSSHPSRGSGGGGTVPWKDDLANRQESQERILKDYHHLNANGMPKGKNGVSNKRILCVRLATDVAIVVPGVSVTVKPRPTAGPTVLVMLDGQNAADTLLPDDGDGNGDGDSSMTIAIATGVLRVPYETKCGCGSVKRGEIPRDIAKWLGHVACNSKDATYGPFTVTIWGLQALIVATLNDPRDTSTATVRGPEPEPDLMIRIGQIPWSITEPAQYAMKYLYLFFELLVELCSHINSLDGARYNFVCVRWFGPLTRIEHGSGSSRGHMHRRNRPIRNAHRGGHIGGNSGFIIRACHDTCLKSLISPDGTHLHPCELFIHALTAAP